MNIYEHFSTYTNLSIKLDTICEQAKEYDAAHEFKFAAVEIDADKMLAMHRMYQEIDSNGNPYRTAVIAWSSSIRDESVRRLVCCKEILHVFDDDTHTAQTLDAVNSLLDQVVVPPSSGILATTASAESDKNGMLHALMILLPRDSLAILKPMVEEGQIGVEDVARLAEIPEPYARLALSDVWQDIVDHIN